MSISRLVADDYEKSDNNKQQSNDNIKEFHDIKMQKNFNHVVIAT